MKRVLLFVVLGLFAFGLKAQRVDLDKVWYAYNYRNLPGTVLDKSYTTYSISITKTPALDAYSNESTTSKINIEGKKKLESGGHLLVEIKLGDLIIESSEVKERVEVHKDKDGKETGRSYYYKVDVNYSFDASSSVKDYKGKQLASWAMATRSQVKTFSTKEYSKSKEASDYYNNNKLEIKTKLIEEQINAALSSVNSSLNSAFGYVTSSSRELFWDLGSKKHAEYANYRQATSYAVEAIQMFSANEIPAQVSEILKPAIEYFTNLPSAYTSDDKGDKKLRYGAYFNLATIYFYMEQFDLAKEYATKLVTNDYDPKDGEKIIEQVDKVMAQLKKHQMTTRHFVINLENEQGPQSN